MATILKPIDFTDVDSKDCVSGDNYLYYKPFEIDPAVAVAVVDELLTGSISGAIIKVLKDVALDDCELYAKVVKGDPAEAGEDWVNSLSATVATGTGGTDEGRNVYLNIGDDYFGKLLRDHAILPTNTDLSDPPIFQVKEVLICFVEIKIFQDLLSDSRAPFEGQEVLADKYEKKLKEAKECHNKWYTALDENAFFDTPKGTDSPCVGYFGRA